MHTELWNTIIHAALESNCTKTEMWIIYGLRQYKCRVKNVKGHRIKLVLNRLYIQEFGIDYIKMTLAPFVPKLQAVIKTSLVMLRNSGRLDVVQSILSK